MRVPSPSRASSRTSSAAPLPAPVTRGAPARRVATRACGSRPGRLIVEALLALLLAAAAVGSSAVLLDATLRSGDAAWHFDLADQHAQRVTSRLLQAPCAALPAPDRWLPAPRHRATSKTEDGTVRRARLLDEWWPVGLAPRESVHVAATVGTRCE